MSGPVSGSGSTRRELVRRGAAAAGLATGARLLGAMVGAPAAAAQGTDADVVATAIGLEEVAVFAYATMLARGLLDPAAAALAQVLRAHDEAHRDALRIALTNLGRAAPPAPRSLGDHPALAPLARVRTRAGVLAYAIALEELEVATYLDAQGRLQEATLLQTTAQIMAAEAQHLVALRRLLGRPPVPGAFERGSAALGRRPAGAGA